MNLRVNGKHMLSDIDCNSYHCQTNSTSSSTKTLSLYFLYKVLNAKKESLKTLRHIKT